MSCPAYSSRKSPSRVVLTAGISMIFDASGAGPFFCFGRLACYGVVPEQMQFRGSRLVAAAVSLLEGCEYNCNLASRIYGDGISVTRGVWMKVAREHEHAQTMVRKTLRVKIGVPEWSGPTRFR